MFLKNKVDYTQYSLQGTPYKGHSPNSHKNKGQQVKMTSVREKFKGQSLLLQVWGTV